MKLKRPVHLILSLSFVSLSLLFVEFSPNLFEKVESYKEKVTMETHFRGDRDLFGGFSPDIVELASSMKQTALSWHVNNNFTTTPLRLPECRTLSTSLDDLVIASPKLRDKSIIIFRPHNLLCRGSKTMICVAFFFY